MGNVGLDYPITCDWCGQVIERELLVVSLLHYELGADHAEDGTHLRLCMTHGMVLKQFATQPERRATTPLEVE